MGYTPSSRGEPARCPSGRLSAPWVAPGSRRSSRELCPRACDRGGPGEAAGLRIFNDVVLNQVLFRFGDDERTAAMAAAVQREGEAWMGQSVWLDRAAMRISVSCWRTDADDVRRTIDAFARAASAYS